MPWKPGESGNPSGRQSNKRFMQALDRAIAQDDSERIRLAADQLLNLAAAGEQWAVQMLADRLDGKVAQVQVVQGSEDGGPVSHEVNVVFHNRATGQT